MFKWLFKKKGCAKHMNNKLEVIGIDHGWSMMKTISQVFVTGVKEITTTPALFGDVLEYEGKFYKVGTVRQEVKDTKVEDDSFYLLTLAAVAKELKRRGLAEAKVFLAVGLPLTRFGAEKNDFIKYLTKNKRVSFKYENESYHIEIDDVAVFPQCYAAVVDKIPAMAKKTLIVDIGSWTIDIMPVINKSPDESKCVTIPKGLITCMRSINEQCVRQLNGEVDESEIQNIMRYGRSDIDDEYFAIIKAEIEDFVDKVYNSIREFGYNLKTTPIVFVGGGAVVMKNFGSHDAKNISYNLDVKANARGYGNVVDTWTSDAKEAHVIKRLVVGETYTLREQFAPYGYLKAADIQFTVEDTGKVQHVEMKDEVPTGSIVINKDGEFVTDTTLMKGYWYDFIFNFFKDSLAGVTFDVYAKEDIVSADGLDTVYHKAGDKVATIVTNDKGIARIDDLPLGRYYLVETKTIDGFVLDDTPIEADLSYIDQNTKVVFAGMDVTNERQKVQISVTKTDSETKKELEGAVFGLFAKEDIVNKDGKVIVKADTQIERGVTGKNGKVTFTSDLPLGQYYVKELEAPKGYVKSDKTFDVDASYQGDKVKVIEFDAAFENAPIKVEISKTDITGAKELPGAKLSVIDSDGKLVESWTSEAGKTHMIERLPVGKYTLREESAPYGYKVAKDVTFEVKETAEIQKVSMKDEQTVGKIVIEKTDKVTGKPIEGVVFEVRDKDGKVLDTLTTDKNGHAESKELPICTYNEDGSFKEDIHYTVVETKAADGYILDETAHDVTLRYDDNAPDVVVATLKLANVPTEPKLPQTGDNANPLLYLGIGALALITGVGVGLRGRKKKNKQ